MDSHRPVVRRRQVQQLQGQVQRPEPHCDRSGTAQGWSQRTVRRCRGGCHQQRHREQCADESHARHARKQNPGRNRHNLRYCYQGHCDKQLPLHADGDTVQALQRDGPTGHQLGGRHRGTTAELHRQGLYCGRFRAHGRCLCGRHCRRRDSRPGGELPPEGL